MGPPPPGGAGAGTAKTSSTGRTAVRPAGGRRRPAETVLPALLTLREVQGLDDDLRVVDGRLADAPRALAAIDREETEARGRLEQAERALEENGAARRRAEAELEDAEAAVEKYEGQLLGASSNVEYKGLQTQIRTTRERISGVEDRILELMEEEGRLTKARADERTGFQEAAARMEKQRETVRAVERDNRAERETLLGRRKEAASRLTEALLARYERVRKAKKGLAVALVSVDRCSACHVRLRPQLFEELRAGQQVLTCEACARLLCYDPPPGEGEAEAEADAAAEAPAEASAG